MLGRIDRIAIWAVVLLFALTGVAVFVTGLGSQFQGDDLPQIVNAVPVHSLRNIPSFFHEGTFFYGDPKSLSGGYYRPLMTTSFAFLYSVAGLNTLPFHAFQLALHIANSVMLFLVLRYVFLPRLALPLALAWLVHPLNSQVVYAIPYLQDALFFFFGISALWVLMRSRSIRGLFVAAALLFLSLLGKETGIFFVAVSVAYLAWFDRRRLRVFLTIVSLPLLAWFVMRLSAVGLATNPNNAPIDSASLPVRLINIPAIVWFYLSRLFVPIPLASGYYWLHSSITFTDFVLPLIGDVVAVSLVVLVGARVRHVSSEGFRWYLFFTLWTAMGIAAHLQLVPLDETVSETYAYFPSVGLLGLIGVAVGVALPATIRRLDPRAAIAVVAGVLLLLGLRSSVRGLDWHSDYTLAAHDITVSPDDYNADIALSTHFAQQGDLPSAVAHARHAVATYPTFTTYNALANVLFLSRDYGGAWRTFNLAISKQETSLAYENMAVLSLYYGNQADDLALFQRALNTFPNDGKIWYLLALYLQLHDNNADARNAITKAAQLGSGNQSAYDQIMNNEPIKIQDQPTLG
jgi:tetratricopeptide (TPR) repeat protein